MFEYTTRWWEIPDHVSKPSERLEELINEMAADGWRLVSLSPWRFKDVSYDGGLVLATANTAIVVFEREKK